MFHSRMASFILTKVIQSIVVKERPDWKTRCPINELVGKQRLSPKFGKDFYRRLRFPESPPLRMEKNDFGWPEKTKNLESITDSRF